MTGLDMAILLDPDLPEVRAAAERSRELLEQMRAKRVLELLDEALARPSALSSAGGTRSGDQARVRDGFTCRTWA
jgi:hypothetical protein